MDNSNSGGNSMDRGTLFRRIQELSFVKTELELYLDGHPTSRDALQKYYETVEALDALTEKYEGTYGPLTARGTQGGTWTWIDGPWPWQRSTDGFAGDGPLDCRGVRK